MIHRLLIIGLGLGMCSCPPARITGQVSYLLLDEVVPQAKIRSETEGVIELEGTTIYLGRNDLKRKQFLIDSLDLLAPDGYAEIDMRFAGQIILKRKEETHD